MTFYDKIGIPRCYTEDLIHIYDYAGTPIAYIYNNKIWKYGGKCIGFLHNNWIIDICGNYIFFSENAIGGPLKPLKRLTPLKGLKKLKPLKALRQLPPLKPLVKLKWSDLNFQDFFTN